MVRRDARASATPKGDTVDNDRCGHQFNIEDVLAFQLFEDEMRAESDQKASALQAEYEKKDQV